MKKIFFGFTVCLVALASCDKEILDIYPDYASTELDYSLYPNGDSADYANNEWPTFSANTNTDRNVLIEDFTGHRCIFCPPAADLAKQLETNNPNRVFSAAIHTGPEIFDQNYWNANHKATGDFQTIVPPIYIHNFANAEGLQIGHYFGSNGFNSNSSFTGNPRGTVSRIKDGSNQHTLSPINWQSATDAALNANDLKVNIQSAANYFPSTQGLFLHTEIEILDQALVGADLYTVVYLVEDTIVKPQKFPSGDSLEYHHHNVMRGCLDGRPFGQAIDEAHKDANGKYYFNYSVKIASPSYWTDGHVLDPSNMHLLIYVRDADTQEIYQVIKQSIL